MRWTSSAQLEANRENAQHSTGPKTAEGKAISSQNSFRHGFTGRFRLLDFEDPAQYAYLGARLVEEHKPSTPTETILIERMTQHLWLSQRAQTLQTVYIDDEKKLALYLRYQTTNDRGFHKCLNDLLKLRAERRKEANGFVSQEHKKAAEKRKAELHPWRVLRTQAEAEHRLWRSTEHATGTPRRQNVPQLIHAAEIASRNAAA